MTGKHKKRRQGRKRGGGRGGAGWERQTGRQVRDTERKKTDRQTNILKLKETDRNREKDWEH